MSSNSTQNHQPSTPVAHTQAGPFGHSRPPLLQQLPPPATTHPLQQSQQPLIGYLPSPYLYHRTYDDLQNRRLTTNYNTVPPVFMQKATSVGVPIPPPAQQHQPQPQQQHQPQPQPQQQNQHLHQHQQLPPVSGAVRKNTQEVMAKSIAERHRTRPIAEYATVVRQAEISVLNMDPQNNSKTAIQLAEQNRERERQVYAFLWLMKNCVAEQDSYVPRGRIFAQYAASCAQNSLKPLSQASLGKLIRSVFPHLTTRRLGMRGQSRYHYCGLRLVVDEPRAASLQIQSPPNSAEQPVVAHLEPAKASQSRSPSPEILKLEPSPITVGQYSDDFEMVFVEDLFKKVFSNDIPIPSEYSLKFPSIPRDRLPAGTDEDIVSSLESLYHVHCNTIFEHIRFMKFDQLENVLMVFGSGSISPQMYNLFISEPLHDWIYECDHITHVSLIKCLSRMIIDYQNVPVEVLTKLEAFFKTYTALTAKATIDLPVPMVQKKEELIETFSRLVRKLVKYLRFSMQITKLLPNHRDMRQDWEVYVNLDDVLDIVKRDGYDEVIKIIKTFMTTTITELLDDLTAGEVRLDKFVKNYCELLSSIRDVPACKLMDGVTSFSRAFMADISLNLQQRGLPWYYLDMLSSLLVGYCFEINRFIS